MCRILPTWNNLENLMIRCDLVKFTYLTSEYQCIYNIHLRVWNVNQYDRNETKIWSEVVFKVLQKNCVTSGKLKFEIFEMLNVIHQFESQIARALSQTFNLLSEFVETQLIYLILEGMATEVFVSLPFYLWNKWDTIWVVNEVIKVFLWLR